QTESQRGCSKAAGHSRQKRLVSNIRLELLVRSRIPERQLRDPPELIAHVESAAGGGFVVLGKESVLAVDRILLVINSNIGSDKPSTGSGKGSVVFTANTVF